MSKVKTLSITI